MTDDAMKKAWDGIIEKPVLGRSVKPRTTGLTMVIDKGLGLNRIQDMVEVAGDSIDIVKLAFGTSVFFKEDLILQKTEMLLGAGIDVMPGGTLLEIAIWEDVFDEFLKKAKKLGFSTLEVSDGTIELDPDIRKKVIQSSTEKGFKVITEVGKKDPDDALPLDQIIKLIEEDQSHGAFKAIVEAREAGKGVGIFDEKGNIRYDMLQGIISGIKGPDFLIWEAPLKKQQNRLISIFGQNVNLGNIPADDILALESLRQGLRGDTLKTAYDKRRK